MKKLTNKNRAMLVGLLCGGVVVSAVAGGTLCANAATVAPSFAIKETASIRTEMPTGIRFETLILKSEYEALKAKNAVYGTVINSQKMLGDNELTLGVAGAVDVKATNWKLSMKDDEKTAIDESLYNQYNAVLVGDYDEETDTYAGLPEAMYGVKLVARSYVTYTDENGETVTEYGEKQAIRSISDVAKGAIMDTERTYKAEEYAYFHSITDYAAQQNAMSAVSVNTALDMLNASIPVSSSYGAVQAIYTFDGEEYVQLAKGDVWTYADGKLTFADDFLKALEYGDYTMKVFAEKDVFELTTTLYGESTFGQARTLGFDMNNTVDNVRNVKEDTTIEWLSNFEGEKGVMHIKNSGYATGYSFVTDYTVAQLQAMAWDYIEYKVYLTNTTETPYSYCSWSGDKSLGALKVGAWNTVRITKADLTTLFNGKIDDFYGVFNKSGAGFKAFWAYGTGGADVYFDYINFGSYDRVMDFETEDEISFLRSGTNAQWLESSTCDKGVTENGVISYYHGTTQYAGVKFQFNNYTGMGLDDWDKIQIRIRIIRGSNSSQKGTDGSFGTFYMGNTSVSIGSVNNGWSTLTITKAQIEASDQYSVDSFWSAFTGSEGARLFWCYYVWDAADWTIQIASISLLKN